MKNKVEIWDDEDLWGDICDVSERVSEVSLGGDHIKEVSFEKEMMAKDINEVMEKAAISGIPLPRNITPSSLIGGTIRRLGTRKMGVTVMDDWGDDIQLTPGILNEKCIQRSAVIENDDVFGDIEDWPSKFEKPQTAVQKRLREGLLPRKSVEPSIIAQNNPCDDIFESDFDIPNNIDNFHIHYPHAKTHTLGIPHGSTLESDNDDWGESSLGIRSAGAESISARASVASSLSPSMNSMTLSEDESILEGIELPSSALDLQKRFDICRQKKINERTLKEAQFLKEDFFADIEVDRDNFLDSSKNFNSNVNIVKHFMDNDKQNAQRQPQATIKLSSKSSRIPQPVLPLPKMNKENISRPSYSEVRPLVQEKMMSKKPSLMNFQEQEDNFHSMSTKRSMPSLQSQYISPPQYNLQDNSRLKSNTYNIHHNHPKTVLENGHLKAQSNNHSSSNQVYSRGSDEFPAMANRIPRYASPTNASLARGAIPLNKFQKCTSDGIPRDHSPFRILACPQKPSNYGDGTELDAFDDLPTCSATEKKYSEKIYKKEHSKLKEASDVLLETYYSKIPEMDRYKEESSKGIAHPAIVKNSGFRPKTNIQLFPTKIKLKKKTKQMPTLIRNLNSSPIPKVVGQMKYNPQTRNWEGNEIELQKFDLYYTSPRPALISHISDKKDVQIVGDMMFDPQKMCWIKINPSLEDENDPFEGIKDLANNDPYAFFESGNNSNSLSNSNYLDTQNFVVGEEFDVGPGFVRKQREEEENWKKNIQGWIKQGFPNRNHLREIRKIVINGR
ncbi:hypothetical protein T552_01969 [Pneumocystis carinii B80]|uniref:Uncharacterized protein n=1 Tax=Pneumocystis carinii (strain B80) TaxID=1408658 RepID=A0A0W4ZIB2_PNEC8|nr:hypothetical protein T552_01969 [Pneumocystis carinii B80]KTW28108.1 hypothetical protein T552_01969 [Pneumocystis carinii B80]